MPLSPHDNEDMRQEDQSKIMKNSDSVGFDYKKHLR
jgi:hypothetical protein